MNNKQTPVLHLIRTIRDSHSTSYWLSNALESAELRDPVDVLNDAETLVNLFKARLEEMQNEAPILT
jgi:hypothetical protein